MTCLRQSFKKKLFLKGCVVKDRERQQQTSPLKRDRVSFAQKIKALN